MTVKDLAGLGHRLPRDPGKAHSLFGPAVEPLDLPWLLSQMHASIRAAERMRLEEAARMMASHLEVRMAERLAAQEEIWKERLERRRRELSEEDELVLAAHAAKIRREALPDLSALEMELALCPEEERRMALEKELVRVVAAIEEEVSRKREELEKARERSLEEIRREAREALDRLAANLRAETQRALGDYLTREGEAFSAWLTEDLRAEAALLRAWKFGNDDGGKEREGAGGEAGG